MMKSLFYTIAIAAASVGCVESEKRSDEGERSVTELMDVADGVEIPEEVLVTISAKATRKNLAISRIAQPTENTLEVMTGTFADGSGEVFRFVRDGRLWALDSQTVWVE